MKKVLLAIFATVVCVLSTSIYTLADEWVKDGDGYKYEYTDGTYAEKGWLKISGNTYYIKSDGTRQTGWLETTSYLYYFGKDGKMYKNRWLTLKDGTKYYFDEKGHAATGFKIISENKYYFSKDGKMKTSSWVKTSSGKNYYCKKDGSVAKNCKLLIGKDIYKFDEKGVSKKTKEKMDMSAYDFEAFMNDLFESADMKKTFGDVEITCSERIGSYFAYDVWIKVNISGMWTDCYEYTYTKKYTESEKKDFIDKNVKLQCLIFSYAEKLMPGKKISGGYYDSFYEYPHLRVGLVSNRAFTWVNYSNPNDDYYEAKYTGKMRWNKKYDDYDFKVTNDMIKEIDIPEIEVV